MKRQTKKKYTKEANGGGEPDRQMVSIGKHKSALPVEISWTSIITKHEGWNSLKTWGTRTLSELGGHNIYR
jgi:hypothetical protein